MCMAARLRNLGIEVAGWALLALAVIVLPLPIVPSLLLIASLAILSSRYMWAEKLLDKVRRIFRFKDITRTQRNQNLSTQSNGVSRGL